MHPQTYYVRHLVIYLPLSSNEKIGGVCFDSVFNSDQLEALSLTVKQLASVDYILSKVIGYTKMKEK